MSTLLNAAGETLSAILSNAPAEGQNRLVTAWVRQQGTSLGSQNFVFYLRADPESEQLYSNLYSSASAQWIATGRNGATGVQAYQTGVVHEEDVWQLVGHYVSGNNGTSNGTLQLGTDGEFRASASVPYSTPSNRVLDRLFIGGEDVSSFGRWRGYVAEFAVWTPADFAAAQAIFAELATKRPDVVAAGTPIFYAPLLDDATVAIGGTTLSVNGTTTFHDDVHPSLAAGSTPDAPTIGAVTNVTHNSATINWTDNSDDEDGFKVEYGVSVSGTVSSWGAASGSPAAADAESLGITGLTPETTYKARVAATNANGDSAWVETAEFTTSAAPPVAVKGVRIQLSAGAESLTGLLVRWWDDPEASGAPDYEADDETTDASGWLEIDLDSVTALDVDDLGYLLVIDPGANPEDDMLAGGRVPIVDLSE